MPKMRKRDAKGHFIPTGKKSVKKRPASRTALGYTRERPMAKKKTSKAAPKKRRSGGRKGGGGAGVTSNRKKMEIVGAGAVWGWATSSKKRAEVKAGEQFWADKLPEIKAVGKDGTAAILAHFVAANSSGAVRQWADNLSVALAGAAAVQLGRVDFKGESLQGDERGEVSGSLDGDEDAYQHDA
jgi:hypothetical protein